MTPVLVNGGWAGRHLFQGWRWQLEIGGWMARSSCDTTCDAMVRIGWKRPVALLAMGAAGGDNHVMVLLAVALTWHWR